MRSRKEMEYDERQELAFTVIRESLINFYLERKDFNSLKALITDNWKEAVITENIPSLVWVCQDKKGDYFIPSYAMNELEITSKNSDSLIGLEGEGKEFEYEYQYEWILTCAIDDYLEKGFEHLFFPDPYEPATQ